MSLPYPPLQVEIRTPRVTLRAASDDVLEGLIPVVREGIVRDDEMPLDDPIHYETSRMREWRWLRGVWAARARAEPSWWRLSFVVDLDPDPALPTST